MKKIIRAAAFAVCVVWVVSAQAEVREFVGTSQDAPRTDKNQNVWVPVSVPAAQVAGNVELVFAEFTFEDNMVPGTEVEVWPRLAGDQQAWELKPIPFPRNLWTMDERTGTLARFDVTSIVKAWDVGDVPNLGLVVRVIVDADATTPIVGFVSPKSFKVAYSTEVVPVSAAHGTKEPGRSHTKRVVDGGGE